MKNKFNHIKIAKSTIDLEINALKKLKKNIQVSFNQAVEAIVKCKSKVIIIGVGKSGIIASKISATLSSVGTPSFSLSASDCSHGDMGAISKDDLLILISNSGTSSELTNIINYANRNRIKIISIVSNKKSLLYNSSDIKILIPATKEAGLGIVPTSSTIAQLSIGDALAVATINKKNISMKDFKKFHPSGSLGVKLKTVEDIMLVGDKIPFVDENISMKKALKVISMKKLGTLIVINKKKQTKGIITDGQIRRKIKENFSIANKKVKEVMTNKPIFVSRDTLAAKALSIMNVNKITSLLVNANSNNNKTIGIVHIHNILSNISNS